MSETVQLVKVVTYHKKKFRHTVGELFGKLGVAAVGWHKVGDLTGKSMEEMEEIMMEAWQYSRNHAANAAGQLTAWRDRINHGNIIFAYECDNIVARVGDVIGRYRYDPSNELGDPSGQFKYPQQVKVSWRDKPRIFHREKLSVCPTGSLGEGQLPF